MVCVCVRARAGARSRYTGDPEGEVRMHGDHADTGDNSLDLCKHFYSFLGPYISTSTASWVRTLTAAATAQTPGIITTALMIVILIGIITTTRMIVILIGIVTTAVMIVIGAAHEPVCDRACVRPIFTDVARMRRDRTDA